MKVNQQWLKMILILSAAALILTLTEAYKNMRLKTCHDDIKLALFEPDRRVTGLWEKKVCEKALLIVIRQSLLYLIFV